MRFDVVVSAENSHYFAWQAMLFHYSCLLHTGQAPVVVVHSDTDQLVWGFRRIEEQGGRVQRAPNFRVKDDFDYGPRNTAGTLLSVRSEADYVVVCDPDMIFLGSLDLQSYRLAGDQISFDMVSYLHVDTENESLVSGACQRAGISLERIRQNPISGGVPHIVPAELREIVGREWLRCVECFRPHERPSPGQPAPHLPWLANMWALVFAVHRLGLRAVMTRFCMTNFDGHRPLASADAKNAAMMHYCYGDSVFQKRCFVDETNAYRDVLRVQAANGSVNETLCAQLRAAGAYYGLTNRVDVRRVGSFEP